MNGKNVEFLCLDSVFFLVDVVTGMMVAVSSLLVVEDCTEIQR
jgi:hypothetical protein